MKTPSFTTWLRDEPVEPPACPIHGTASMVYLPHRRASQCWACTEPEHTDRAGSPIGTEVRQDPAPTPDRGLAGRVAPGGGLLDFVIESERRRLRLDTEEFRRTRADWDAAHAAYAARTGTIEVATGVEAGDEDDRALAGLWGRTRLSGEALRVALAKVPR